MLEKLGREVLGPPFCFFVWTVIARAQERGWDRLFFAAREGHLFRALYDRLIARLGAPSLPSSYVYVSRLSTALASVRGFGEREILIGLSKGASRSVRELFQAFELWEPAVEERTRAAGFGDPERWIRDAHDARFRRLLDDAALQSLIDERARAARARLKRYFVAEGLAQAKRPALVDIGWSGTIQNNLARAFAGDPELAPLDGIYFALKHLSAK
jgi:predicted HAD superfamily hydrolase